MRNLQQDSWPMHANRVLVGLAILVSTSAACGDTEPERIPARPVTTVTSTTSTTVPATTTTSQAPRTAIRASRGSPRTVPPPSAPAPSEAVTDCGMWGYKTRAQSDACWGPYIASYGDWPTGRMLAILYCESKGNPWAVNASNHVGLFQIKNSHTKGDGPGNIAHAHAMWLRSGTAPWRQCGG